jgi:Ser/Thr protein kinase RdoA (MazF antagonist)
MDPSHLPRLLRDYDLGSIISITESIEGVLNHNYNIVTTSGRYFLKKFRYKTNESIAEIALIETLMHDRDVPAVCMIPSRTSAPYVAYDDEFYALYPFIESNRSHRYSLSDYYSFGATLARIHLAGSYDLPEALRKRTFPEVEVTQDNIEHFVSDMQEYVDTIDHKINRDPVDETFVTYINLKLSLVPSIDFEGVLPHDTLIHGDYHMHNLFIDTQTRDIIGIGDWEHANYFSRAYELVRSYLYICFPEQYDKGALPIAQSFMSGYQSVYPISDADISRALRVRLRHLITKTWLEKRRYKHNDTRSDHLVGHDMRIIQDFFIGNMSKEVWF